MADNIKKIIQIEFQVNNSPVQQFEGTLDEVIAKVAEVEEAISTIPDVELKLKVDGVEKTTQELKDLGKQANTTEKAVQGLAVENGDLSKSFADIYGETQPLTGKLGELEDRLYQLGIAGKTGTAEFAALTAEAGRLRRAQIEVDLAVDSASKTIGQKLGGALNGVAGGFAVAQGAAGLFGSENEKVEKALLKVQSALAIVSGITAFRENKKDIVGLATSFGKLGNSIGGAIVKMLGFGTASAVAGAEAEAGFAAASTGAKGFSIALTATGIGAIIVGIGVALAVVAAYWDDITKAVSGVASSERDSLEKAQKNTTEQQRKLDNLNAQDETLKAQGKTEDEILKIKEEQAKKILAATKLEQAKAKQIRDAEIAQKDRYSDLLTTFFRTGLELSTLALRILAAPVDAIIAVVNKVSEKLGLGTAIDFNINAQITKLNESIAEKASKALYDPEQAKKELKASYKEQLDTEEAALIEAQNTVDGYANQRKEKKKQAAEKAKKAAEDAAKKQAELERQIEEETTRHENEKIKIADEATKLGLEKRKLAQKSLLDQLKTDQQLELDALKKGYADQIKAKEDLDEQLGKQVTSGKDASGNKLTQGQIDAIKTQRKNLSEEIVKLKENETTAVGNLQTTQAKNTSKLLDEQLKEQQAYSEEVYGLTLELVNAQTDLENKALAERLKSYGFTEEEIAKIVNKRKDEAAETFKQNTAKLDADKAYFDELAKIYNNDTLNQEQRAKEIEKLDKKRTADALANELKVLNSKQKAGEEETQGYKERAAKIAEIEAQQAANTVAETEKTEEEKKALREAAFDQAVELANALADLAQALLEVETAKIEAEYEKRAKSQQDKNDELLSNQELTAEQRAELERRNAVELEKIEEEKQAKLKEIQKKQADIDLAINIANIIASTAAAIASAIGPQGIVLIPLYSAIGAAQLAAAVAQRKAIQGLARGGMIYGSGGPTDDLIPIMASNGEAVINAAAVKKFAPVLSAINESTGGAPIKPRFYAAGGIVSATPGQVTVSNINDIAAVAGQSAVRAYILDADVTSQSVKNARLVRQSRIK
jgi:hypothetical protein